MNPLAALARTEKRGIPPALSWDQYLSFFTYNGSQFVAGLNQTLKQDGEKIGNNFQGYAESAYMRNGIVFAVMLVRMLLFSQARFTFRDLDDKSLSWSDELEILRKPWPGATTGDLLARVIQDADLAGNFFGVRKSVGPDRLRRRRPDWMTIATGVPDGGDDEDEEVIGYFYEPGGPAGGNTPIFYGPNEVVHYAPIPDPLADFRGMSWLTPIVREVQADTAATTHKLKFFENGATPNMLVKSPVTDPEKFKQWVEIMEEKHAGVTNAYRTMYIGGGADATVVGKDFQQLDFKVTQGAGETRIAAAGGVPPVVVGLSEGLQGSSLNAGNYGQARRRLSDGTLWPLWENLAGSMATVINEPSGKELWIDARGVKFLREDEKDAAEILATQMQAIRTGVDAGFKPDTVVKSVIAGDLDLLDHTDLYSVQLQPAGSNAPNPGDE